VPFDHNACYHRLMLRQVPPAATRALDVGCGTGGFARRLARAGLHVDAVDVDPSAIAFARAAGSPGPGAITYRCADLLDLDLPAAQYDVVTCIAALHHLPFDTVTRLAAALRPGGVLLVLGLARARSLVPLLMWGVLAPPVNLLPQAAVALGERCNSGPDPAPHVRLSDPEMSVSQVQRASSALLPGATVRTLLFWRYLLVYRTGAQKPVSSAT
jgi:SAM-dependent methyltransferase